MEGESQPKLIAQAFIKIFDMGTTQDYYSTEYQWFEEFIRKSGKVSECSYLFQEFFTEENKIVLLLGQDVGMARLGLKFNSSCGSVWV